MQKQLNEKTVRLRYIRVLEKFITKTVSLLKKENFDIELYKKATIKSYQQLLEGKTANLYNQYPLELKKIAQYILDTIETHSDTFEDEKNNILKQVNLLDKLKNNSRYKKDKHKKQKFTMGY